MYPIHQSLQLSSVALRPLSLSFCDIESMIWCGLFHLCLAHILLNICHLSIITISSPTSITYIRYMFFHTFPTMFIRTIVFNSTHRFAHPNIPPLPKSLSGGIVLSIPAIDSSSFCMAGESCTSFNISSIILTKASTDSSCQRSKL